MIEKFNGIFYLILFSIHFLGLGFYAYQMIIGNQKFRNKFQIDEYIERTKVDVKNKYIEYELGKSNVHFIDFKKTKSGNDSLYILDR